MSICLFFIAHQRLKKKTALVLVCISAGLVDSGQSSDTEYFHI